MEKIVIKDKTYGTIIQRFCYPVNEYLGVVPFRDHYKIFKLKQGKPFIGTQFSTLEDAIKAVQIFIEVYGEYLPIWDNKEWFDADIPALCRYTVRNGINLWELVKKTEQHGKPILCASLYERLA
jgi:hypothetical protein